MTYIILYIYTLSIYRLLSYVEKLRQFISLTYKSLHWAVVFLVVNRTKLKQTEVDCEYLKRCCETLSEENRRLQKELQELRALKASNSNPFFMQLPATTLTMCPSCERVAPNNSSSNNNNSNNNNSASASNSPKPIATFPFSKPKFYPFPHSKPHQSWWTKTSHQIILARTDDRRDHIYIDHTNI